jgi:NAD-dependent SIR2 family protein deacetylase
MSYKMLQFTCDKCNHSFEDLIWISELDDESNFELPICPECEKGRGTRDKVQSKCPRHVSWSLWQAGN